MSITIKERIGIGSYGSVFKCLNEYGETLAVKVIKKPSLFEAAIMSTIYSPYLNRAMKIQILNNKMYIVQELAICDIKSYKDQYVISNDLMVKWIYEISRGIQYLHRENIIHGDIKSSNVLLYPGDRVKLSDFTLSTKRNWNKNYRPCTNTYRPIEGWSNNWDLPLDIWSFGCTIYYMIFGKNLFKDSCKELSITAIKNLKLSRTNNSYPEIYRLFFSIMKNNPIDRPTIDEILSDQIFLYFSHIPSFSISQGLETKFDEITKKKILLKYGRLCRNKDIIKIAFNIYSRTTGLIHINDNLRLTGTLSIATKLVNKSDMYFFHPLKDFGKNELEETKKSICNHLSYTLYKGTSLKLLELDK